MVITGCSGTKERWINQVLCRFPSTEFPHQKGCSALDSLSGAQWFSTIDRASGYWQVEVAEEDKEKTAFTTLFGLFQFRTMPFGLCNAPGTFQHLMEWVLAGLHWSTFLVYIDNIILFSRTVQEHFQNLTKVFQRLKQAGLKLKPRKCHLFWNKVKYLGYVVSKK